MAEWQPPQLAKTAAALPDGSEWAFEPKWDGYRATVYATSQSEGSQIYSRSGKELNRYFPELQLPQIDAIIDCELIVCPGFSTIPSPEDAVQHHSFEVLNQRIHPAQSRIDRLSLETPAYFAAFDLLQLNGEDISQQPFSERRKELEKLAATGALPEASWFVTPLVGSASQAEEWLQQIEGVVAKNIQLPYLWGKRHGMLKIKRKRTLDCVVAGYREGKTPQTIGSLILALYDGGELRVVGHTSALKGKEKAAIFQELQPYVTGVSGPEEKNRWSSGKDTSWTELKPDLVVEVAYDQASAGRIRHGASLLRWRDDKQPAECLFSDLD